MRRLTALPPACVYLGILLRGSAARRRNRKGGDTLNLCDLNDLRELLGRHGFHFSKSMGQNFLIDPAVPERIADASGASEDWGVLEVGPGVGPLTVELARRAGKAVSVEVDKTLLPVLAETLAGFPNAEVVSGDVMRLNLDGLLEEKFGDLPVMACANLPYNITTPVLTKFVETGRIRQFTAMIQREVAQRLCAPPGSSGGGAFTLFLQYHMEAEYLFPVTPDKFYPAPKVTSAVIRCVRREKPPVEVEDEKLLFQLMRGAFALRRKTLANSLSAALQRPKEELLDAIRAAGLPETVRGEQLAFEQFAALCEKLGK